MRPISSVFALILVATALPADANEALRRCRAMTDSASRLACYDALPLDAPRVPGATAGPAPAPGPAPRTVAPATSSYPSPAPTPSMAQPTPAPPASPQATFGMEG